MSTPAERAAERILGFIYQTLLFGNTEKLLNGKDWIAPLVQQSIDETIETIEAYRKSLTGEDSFK